MNLFENMFKPQPNQNEVQRTMAIQMIETDKLKFKMRVIGGPVKTLLISRKR